MNKKSPSLERRAVPPSRRSSRSSTSKSPAQVSKSVKQPKVVVSPVEIDKAFSERTGPLLVAELWGQPEVPFPVVYKDYVEQYEQLAWVYSSVFAISSGAAIVPWKIWKGGVPSTSEGGKPLGPETKEVRLFLEPNEDQSWYDLLEGTLTSLELGGNGYWEVARNIASKPSKLYLMRPDRITIKPRKDGKGVKSYRFKVTPNSRKGVDFLPEDCLHFFYFNPWDDWYGMSPLSAAAQACISEHYTIKYNQNFFRHDATPSGYLGTDQPISKTQSEEIGKGWRQNMGGVDKAHKVPVLPKGLKFHVVGINPRDIQFLRQRQYNREEILSVFGVPPVKVGLLEHAKYDNYKLQEGAFYRDTIQPKLKKIEGVITRFLRREFGDDLAFRFDMSDYLTEDRNLMAERCVKLFTVGAMTPNDIIKKFGLGEGYPDGDVYYISALYVPVGEEGVESGERQTTALLDEMKREMGSSYKKIKEFAEMLEEKHPQLVAQKEGD